MDLYYQPVPGLVGLLPLALALLVRNITDAAVNAVIPAFLLACLRVISGVFSLVFVTFLFMISLFLKLFTDYHFACNTS